MRFEREIKFFLFLFFGSNIRARRALRTPPGAGWLDGVASDSSRVLWRSTTGNPQRFGPQAQLGIRPVFDQPTRRSLEFNETFSSGFRNGVIALYCLVPGVQDSRCTIIGDTVSGLGNCVAAAAAKSALAKADGRMGRVGWAAAGGSGAQAGTVQAWAGLGRAGRGPRRGRRRGPGAQWRGGPAERPGAFRP